MRTDQANDVLEAALDYAARGWRVVPLYGVRSDGACECSKGAACNSTGKHPRVNVWHQEATTEEAKVAAWWAKWPTANVGVALGEASGIIDIECDSSAAEAQLVELFGGEFPVTPTFESRRGKHRLFKWRLGFPLFGNKKIGEIDLKLGNVEKGSQSAFPPSARADGKRYRWLLTPDECPLAEIDDATLHRMMAAMHADRGGAKPSTNRHTGRSTSGPPPVFKTEAEEAAYYNNLAMPSEPRSARHKLYEQEAVGEGERNNTLYADACAMWGEQVKAWGPQCLQDPERQATVYTRVHALNAVKCRPPLDDADVLTLVESARKFIAEKGSDVEKMANLTALGLEFREGEWWPGAWHTETVNSDPPTVRLYAPFLPKKFISLATDDFDTPSKVHRAVLAATGDVCLAEYPGFWEAIWNGTRGDASKGIMPKRGIKAKLSRATKRVQAPAEVQKHAVMAGMLLAAFSKAKVVEDGGEPDARGRPSRLSDGSVVFAFSTVWEPMILSPDRFSRGDLSAMLREVGATDKSFRTASGPRYLKVMSKRSVAKLESLLHCVVVPEANENPNTTPATTP